MFPSHPYVDLYALLRAAPASLRRRHAEKPQPSSNLNLVPGVCYMEYDDGDDVDDGDVDFEFDDGGGGGCVKDEYFEDEMKTTLGESFLHTAGRGGALQTIRMKPLKCPPNHEGL